LSEQFPLSELNAKRGAIKHGIAEFFAQTFQEISLSIIEGRIAVTKQFAYPKKGEAFDRLYHALILDLIEISDAETRFQVTPSLWVLPAGVRDALFAGLGKLDEVAARPVLRTAIETVFGLDEKDIILFMRGRIYIRGYRPPTPLPEGIDRRYAGEDPDELAAFYMQHFPDTLEEEIETALPDLLDDQLNFSAIDNAAFNRTYVMLFRSLVETILSEYLPHLEPHRLEALGGYVLRRHFDGMLILTAWELLFYVEERNRNAEAFVKYYKDEVVIDAAGKKVQKHAIVDSTSQSWHYSAILATLMQYRQSMKRLEQQEQKVQNTLARIEELRNEVDEERCECKTSEHFAQELGEMIAHKKALKQEELGGGALNLAQFNQEYSELLDRLKAAKDDVLFANRRFKNKQTELENWIKQLEGVRKVRDEIIEQNRDIETTVERIAHAIAVVFSKR